MGKYSQRKRTSVKQKSFKSGHRRREVNLYVGGNGDPPLPVDDIPQSKLGAVESGASPPLAVTETSQQTSPPLAVTETSPQTSPSEVAEAVESSTPISTTEAVDAPTLKEYPEYQVVFLDKPILFLDSISSRKQTFKYVPKSE